MIDVRSECVFSEQEDTNPGGNRRSSGFCPRKMGQKLFLYPKSFRMCYKKKGVMANETDKTHKAMALRNVKMRKRILEERV